MVASHSRFVNLYDEKLPLLHIPKELYRMRSGDCEVNLSSSRNQLEMMLVL